MKVLQKLILPLLVLLVVFIIYSFYFNKKGTDLGSFDDFDPNNNAVKEILVQIVPNQTIDPTGGNFNFSVSDKNGKVLQAFGSAPLPENIQTAEKVILKGHVNQSGFCTHEVVLE